MPLNKKYPLEYSQFAPIHGIDVSRPEEQLQPLTSPYIRNCYTVDGALEGAGGYTELLTGFPSLFPVMEGVQFGDSAGTLHLVFMTTDELIEYVVGTPDTWADRSGGADYTGDDSNPIFMAPVGGLSTENLYITNGLAANNIKVWSGTGNWTTLTTTGFTYLNGHCLAGFKGHLVLGNTIENTGSGNTFHPFRVRFSVQSDPTTWTGETSGFINLIQDKDNSKVQTLWPFKEALLAYKETAISRLSYKGGVGGVYFSETQSMAESGAISPKGVAAIGDLDMHMVITQSDIELFDGLNFVKRARNESYGRRIRKEFFADLNWDMRGKIFAATIPEKYHVKILLPTGASTTCNRCYTWDWNEDAWFREDFNDVGYSLVYVNNFFNDRKALYGIGSNIMQLYSGNNHNGTAIARTWRTRKHNLGDLDPSYALQNKTTNRQELDYSGTAPTVKVAGIYNSEDTLSFSTGQVIADDEKGIPRTTERDSGRYLSLEVSQTSDAAPFRVAKYTLFVVDRKSIR